MGTRHLRIAVIAPLRFPIRIPHSGGLESAVWSEVAGMQARGHDVTLIAVEGSDFVEPGTPFELPHLRWPQGLTATDVSYPLSYEATTIPALNRALETLAGHTDAFDVVSNHCLHPLPIALAPELGVPMVTTLHTPPDPAFVAAHTAAGPSGSRFLSVSEFTRREWARAGVHSEVLTNGVDPAAWPEGPGGDGIVWFGRIVPEKAPHLAIDVAQALSRPLTIAGRIGDVDYARRSVLPRLGDDISYVGALTPDALARLVGTSAVALSTPAWAEPFGLVAPEALMCGTPVVSFAVGGVPEIAARTVGMELVPPSDLPGMRKRADHLIARVAADPTLRPRIRATAVRRFSLDGRIAAREELYGTIIDGAPLADELTA